ncbi:hypothetical protein CISG_02408 [Coccidioides immitis RMSCC 3703]|uniref:Acyltransferase 3 domain-containing protein n=1 Tax=Coccidioides immitis RMSCC 3703 TaxID=454286 RepID=A0A0J8R6T8_COCIT|nr:hypothetical protein CISG_02408 [Coccidioides immitis RMSCC 3703]
MAPKKRDDNWIDVTYVLLSRQFSIHPAAGAGKGPLLFQLPILRLCVGGRGAVALFFLVTGFVNSMNPIRHFDNGNVAGSLPNVSRSTFTRFGRLILPTNAAAATAWLVCQLGGFNLARVVESDWIRSVARAPGPTPWAAIKALLHNMTMYWHDGSGTYDPTHWAVVYFLRGSMRIYLTLLATSLVKTRWRILIIILLHSFCWWTNDYITGINIYSGMLFAQLQATFGNRATSLLPRPIPALIILVGVLILSYPQNNQEWMPWSHLMKTTMAAVTPPSAVNFINRYWVNVGVTVLALGIFTSRNARRILSLPLFNFLGRVSFAVYLLHDTLIRTLMTWMIYGPNAGSTDLTKLNDKGQPINRVRAAGPMAFLFAVPVFYGVLYALAHLWTKYVDSWCANAVIWIRDLMFKKEEVAALNGRAGGTGGANGAVAEKELEERQPLVQGDGPVLPVTNHHVSS